MPRRSLRNEFDWQEEEYNSDYVTEFVRALDPKKGLKLSDFAVRLSTRVGNTPKSEVKARRFIDLIKLGDSPAIAARRIGIANPSKLMNTKEFRDSVRDLVETDTLPAAVRRMMVRAGANRIFMENMRKGGDHKLALDAAKIIGADPEVGLNQPTLIGVPIDMGALAKMMAQFEAIPELKQLEEGAYDTSARVDQGGSTAGSEGGDGSEGGCILDGEPWPDNPGSGGVPDSPEVPGDAGPIETEPQS